MSSRGTNSASSSPLCTLGNRRSSKELWLKSVVIHTTMIIAIYLMLGTRGEHLLTSKLLFGLLTPYVTLLQDLVGAAVAVDAQMMVVVSWYSGRHRRGR